MVFHIVYTTRVDLESKGATSKTENSVVKSIFYLYFAPIYASISLSVPPFMTPATYSALSAGMQIKGKKRKNLTAPSSYPQAPSIKTVPYSIKTMLLVRFFLINKSAAPPLHNKFLSLLHFFPPARDKSFWKVESCPKRDHTQSLSIQLLGAGRQTHSHTKWRL